MKQWHWGVMVAGVCMSIGLTGCGGKHAEIKEDRLTVGRVQGEVKVGMSAAQVAELLGSPNIVTTDDKRVVRIHLTAKGKQMRDVSRDTVVKFNQAVQARFTQAQLNNFRQVMSELDRILEQEQLF